VDEYIGAVGWAGGVAESSTKKSWEPAGGWWYIVNIKSRNQLNE
jgi:hypothetical protein